MKDKSTEQRKKQAAELKTMTTLQPDECRWPIGDPQLPGFHFCGEHKEGGNSYCAKHAARASTPGRPRAITYRHGGG